MHAGKILCIDGEEVGLLVRKLMLESEGFEAAVATNGKAALELCGKFCFDLIRLDYSIPGMNGGEVAQAIRLLRPEIPVVLLSPYLTLPEEHTRIVYGHVIEGESTEALLILIRKLLQREADAPDSKERRTA